MTDRRFELVVAPSVRRRLAQSLPQAVALATCAFMTGPLLEDPHCAGKKLRIPGADYFSARRGTYRVIYGIDETHRRVMVLGVFSHAEIHRSNMNERTSP